MSVASSEQKQKQQETVNDLKREKGEKTQEFPKKHEKLHKKLEERLDEFRKKRGNISHEMSLQEKNALGHIVNSTTINRKIQRRAANVLSPEQYQEFDQRLQQKKLNTQKQQQEKTTNETTTIVVSEKKTEKTTAETQHQIGENNDKSTKNNKKNKKKNKKNKKKSASLCFFEPFDLTTSNIIDEDTKIMRPMFVKPVFKENPTKSETTTTF